jgi:hypothetical protein
VLPWGALLGTLGLNFWQHKHGRSTICARTRSVVPPWLFLILWWSFSRWMERHILDGYDVRHIKET